MSELAETKEGARLSSAGYIIGWNSALEKCWRLTSKTWPEASDLLDAIEEMMIDQDHSHD